jgi:dihydropyrimidine dehydrogenase (NAD+) subunit PreA
MTDLSLDFCGLELKNPLIVASSDAMRDIRQIKQAEECGASAVILKGMLPSSSVGLDWLLRLFLDIETKTVCGIAGGKMLSYDQGIELIKTAKQETKIKIGANMPFQGLDELENYIDVAKKVARAGADFIEMNFSPQVSAHVSSHIKAGEYRQDTEADILKATMEDLPKWILEGVQATRQAVDIPIITKLCPEGIDVVSTAKVMEAGGANAIDAINIGGGSMKIDIFNGGKPAMPGAGNSSLATAGSPLKTFAQGIVARISRNVNIPVMGTGGLMKWQDVVEMMMFGATAVSFCTLLLIHGFQALTMIEKGIREYMEMQGYKRLEDFRGLGLKYIASSAHAFDFVPVVARVDEQSCNGCGICLKPAHCLAISINNDRAVINGKECLGCGTCSFICPVHAISMVEIAG